MKNPSLGDYLLWNDKPAKIVAESDGRQVLIELLQDEMCPHCSRSLGKKQIQVIVSSPLFQENARKIPTIVDDDTIIVH